LIYFSLLIICSLISLIYIVFCKKIDTNIIAILFTLACFDSFNIAKIGITINFFEVAIIILFIKSFRIEYLAKKLSIIEIFLLKCLLITVAAILIAQMRILFFDLYSEYSNYDVFTRSIFSNSKLLFFFFCFFFIRRRYNISNRDFVTGVVYGALPTCIFSILQALGVGVLLIHNNPSFGEFNRIEIYDGQRPVGLTNEASFYVFQLCLAIPMLLICKYNKYISNFHFCSIAILIFISILLSISRTGWILAPVIILLIQFERGMNKLMSTRFLLKILVYTSLIVILGTFEIQGFNVLERFASSFSKQSDDSTIDRYNSIAVLLAMLTDKSLYFGVGPYNYMFYASEYFDNYMSNIYSREFLPSFSLILQFMVDYGLILFGVICINIRKLYKRINLTGKAWMITCVFFALTFQITNLSVTYFLLLLSQEES
jgi:hypothetical protein